MPRSVNRPLRHASKSPCAHAPQGWGSGRRTTPTTRSPGAKPLPGGAARTRPSDSWPRTSRSAPSGAEPCRPPTISWSVPQMPNATPSTRSSPSPATGSGTSPTSTDPAFPGTTVRARMLSSSLDVPLLPVPPALRLRFLPVLFPGDELGKTGPPFPHPGLHRELGPPRHPRQPRHRDRPGDARPVDVLLERALDVLRVDAGEQRDVGGGKQHGEVRGAGQRVVVGGAAAEWAGGLQGPVDRALASGQVVVVLGVHVERRRDLAHHRSEPMPF